MERSYDWTQFRRPVPTEAETREILATLRPGLIPRYDFEGALIHDLNRDSVASVASLFLRTKAAHYFRIRVVNKIRGLMPCYVEVMCFETNMYKTIRYYVSTWRYRAFHRQIDKFFVGK